MSYRDNTKGIVDAMNQKRNKYIRQQRKNEKHDSVIDLSGYTEDSSSRATDDLGIPFEGETIKIHYNDDMTVKYRTYSSDDANTRNFRSKVNTQSDKQKGLGSKANPNDGDVVPIFVSVVEGDSKGEIQIEDQYEKYNPEPNAERILESQGATIKHSEITLTDSSGNNRTYVRRKDDIDY